MRYFKTITHKNQDTDYNMGFHRGPKIVTNGLVLALDAANTKSYPGTGTTWSDLSGNNNNATMFGSVPFQTDIAPCFNFATATGANASTSTLGFTFTSNMIPTTGNFTLSCWIKNPNSGSGQVGLFSNSVDGTGYRFGVGLNGIYWLIGPNYAEGTIAFQQNLSASFWYNIVAVFNRTTARIFLYSNGIYQNQAVTQASQTAYSNSLVPGLVRSACCSIYTGKIGTFSAYNRSLTEAEIQQNYNNTKSRFNL